MELQFTVAIIEGDAKFLFIPRGFHKCVVKSLASPSQWRLFEFCLRCRKLRSLSWFLHTHDVRFVIALEWRDKRRWV